MISSTPEADAAHCWRQQETTALPLLRLIKTLLGLIKTDLPTPIWIYDSKRQTLWCRECNKREGNEGACGISVVGGWPEGFEQPTP